MGYNMDMIDFRELQKEEIEKLYGEAAAEAVAETHAAGLPTTHVDEKGRVYDEYPDGYRDYVKPGP